MDPLTVTEISNLVKSAIRSNPELADIAVRGEVTNYSDKKHHYFSLKDESSSIKCVIWSSCAKSIGCLPLENGQKVVVWGSVTTYPAGSIYQIDVKRCVPEGRGDLYRQFLELKKRLLDEGLFDPRHKKPLPAYPGKVGIVTSEKGAALQDMAKVFMSGPGVDIIPFDARVQGEGSAASIAAGIMALDGKVDVIIIGRGGGSIEDLWAFNNEELARAVFACGTPVISAVGHEVDEVITDHVADCRASTPTAAAELIVKGMRSLIDEKSRLLDGISFMANDRLRNSRQELDGYDMPMWSKLIASRIENSRNVLISADMNLNHMAMERVADARRKQALLDSGLRTTWVAAMSENGLAALFQDGIRVRDAAQFRKGDFKGLMRDGKITGEVKDIEV
ncbi:MAG: exodeoxyribonuclease VII large subunit [Thermoplasmata archaeon]